MRRLTITTSCTADVKETWTIDVPDDFDLADGEGADDVIERALKVGTFVGTEDEVDNEEDRVVLNVEEEPLREDQTLTDAHRTVLAECEAETWRNRENGDPEAQSEADVAADIVERLARVYGVKATFEPDDFPAFEWAVEYDQSPAHYYHEDAEKELAKGGGAPPTMKDVKSLAARMAAKDAEPSQVHLLCPYPDCQALDTIVEVDSSIRWNDIEVELCIEGAEERRITGLHVTASTGSDGDSEFDHFLCTACTREVTAPDGFDIESYD